MGEDDNTRKTLMKAIAVFLQKVLPEPATPRTETVAKKKKKEEEHPPLLPSRHFDVGTQTEPIAISSTSAVYDAPKPTFNLYNRRRHLDTRYRIKKDVHSFKVGDSTVLVDTDSDITIRGKEFRWTTGMWELLTRRIMDRRKITTDDLKKNKKFD